LRNLKYPVLELPGETGEAAASLTYIDLPAFRCIIELFLEVSIFDNRTCGMTNTEGASGESISNLLCDPIKENPKVVCDDYKREEFEGSKVSLLIKSGNCPEHHDKLRNRKYLTYVGLNNVLE
jgi:hypothetical protein